MSASASAAAAVADDEKEDVPLSDDEWYALERQAYIKTYALLQVAARSDRMLLHRMDLMIGYFTGKFMLALKASNPQEYDQRMSSGNMRNLLTTGAIWPRIAAANLMERNQQFPAFAILEILVGAFPETAQATNEAEKATNAQNLHHLMSAIDHATALRVLQHTDIQGDEPWWLTPGWKVARTLLKRLKCPNEMDEWAWTHSGVKRALTRREGMNDVVQHLIAVMVSSNIDATARPFVSSHPATRARSILTEAVESISFARPKEMTNMVTAMVQDLRAAGGATHMEAADMLAALLTRSYSRDAVYCTLVGVKLYLDGK